MKRRFIEVNTSKNGDHSGERGGREHGRRTERRNDVSSAGPGRANAIKKIYIFIPSMGFAPFSKMYSLLIR
jgi:hypothetical protein